MSDKTEKVVKAEKKYTKERLINSEAYKSRKDLLKVLLEDNKEYTKTEVDKAIDGYLKKGVK